jgi:TniQ protein
MVDSATFFSLYFPERQNIIWKRDIDLTANDEFLEVLSYKSGLPSKDLLNLTLRSYDSFLAESISTVAANHLIQPLGNYGRMTTMFGLRFCPLCLRDDKIPFFRKTWRLTFSTACIKHRCFLLDRCQKCNSSVSIFRRFYDNGFPQCYKCGAKYKNATPELIPTDSRGLKTIEQLNNILDSGVFPFANRYTYSFVFFEMLYKVIKLVCFWKKDKAFFDQRENIIYNKLMINEPIHRYLTDYPLKVQHVLFSGGMNLFDGLPGNLVSFLADNNMRMSDLLHDLKYVPFWFLEIAERFNFGERRVTIEEVKSVIEYLRAKNKRVHKQRVADILGVVLDFKKRPDVSKLFIKAGRFYLAA